MIGVVNSFIVFVIKYINSIIKEKEIILCEKEYINYLLDYKVTEQIKRGKIKREMRKWEF